MKLVYFISENYLKENSNISLNVESNLLNSAIMDAQEIHVQGLLGTNLYQKLGQLITGSTINSAGNEWYKDLLNNYVIMCVLKWSIVECIPYIRWKFMNKSITDQNSENSTPTDLENIKYLSSTLRDKAQFYNQRLVDYLTYNIQHFPEYSQWNQSQMTPERNAYFCGMVLDPPTPTDRWLGLNKNTQDL